MWFYGLVLAFVFGKDCLTKISTLIGKNCVQFNRQIHKIYNISINNFYKICYLSNMKSKTKKNVALRIYFSVNDMQSAVIKLSFQPLTMNACLRMPKYLLVVVFICLNLKKKHEQTSNKIVSPFLHDYLCVYLSHFVFL